MTKPFRRVVTSHDDAGRAVLLSDAPPTRVQAVGEHGPTFYEVWNTRETPALTDRGSGEPFEARLNHGWANRSGRNCRIAFILIDGEFTDGL
jgi:hypothetical protein